MLTEPTLDKLKELSLYGMADTYLQQRRTPSEGDLSFEDRFGLLVDAEWMLRQNKRLKRRLSEAKLRLSNAAVEDVETAPARDLLRQPFHPYTQALIASVPKLGAPLRACGLNPQPRIKQWLLLLRR